MRAPGFGLARELHALVGAGLSPDEALLTGTRHPAEFLGEGTRSGTVAPGHAADRVLLEGNPLEEIGWIERRIGVMVAGRWYAQAELQARLEVQRATYSRHSSNGSSSIPAVP